MSMQSTATPEIEAARAALLNDQAERLVTAAGGNICTICAADLRPIPHVRWQEGAWCYDCVEIVRVNGRTTVQARF